MRKLSDTVTETRNKEWGKDEFVKWDDITYFQHHDMEFYDKNRENSLKKGYSENELCAFCGKPLKPGYKVIRFYTNGNRQAEYHYNSTLTGGETIRCGNTCFKALQQAHDKKYNV